MRGWITLQHLTIQTNCQEARATIMFKNEYKSPLAWIKSSISIKVYCNVIILEVLFSRYKFSLQDLPALPPFVFRINDTQTEVTPT